MFRLIILFKAVHKQITTLVTKYPQLQVLRFALPTTCLFLTTACAFYRKNEEQINERVALGTQWLVDRFDVFVSKLPFATINRKIKFWAAALYKWLVEDDEHVESAAERTTTTKKTWSSFENSTILNSIHQGVKKIGLYVLPNPYIFFKAFFSKNPEQLIDPVRFDKTTSCKHTWECVTSGDVLDILKSAGRIIECNVPTTTPDGTAGQLIWFYQPLAQTPTLPTSKQIQTKHGRFAVVDGGLHERAGTKFITKGLGSSILLIENIGFSVERNLIKNNNKPETLIKLPKGTVVWVSPEQKDFVIVDYGATTSRSEVQSSNKAVGVKNPTTVQIWKKPDHMHRDLKDLNFDSFSPLRKNRIYIKSRFSRVRQWCRPIVMWSLWVNIGLIFFCHAVFYGFKFNVGYKLNVLLLLVLLLLLPVGLKASRGARGRSIKRWLLRFIKLLVTDMQKYSATWGFSRLVLYPRRLVRWIEAGKSVYTSWLDPNPNTDTRWFNRHLQKLRRRGIIKKPNLGEFENTQPTTRADYYAEAHKPAPTFFSSIWWRISVDHWNHHVIYIITLLRKLYTIFFSKPTQLMCFIFQAVKNLLKSLYTGLISVSQVVRKWWKK